MSQYRARLEVVELDARIVPSRVGVKAVSHLPGSAVGQHAVVSQAPAAQSVTLGGTGSGAYGFSPAHLRNGGTMYVLNGTGTLGSLGHATISGALSVPPAGASGAATGALTFANASGSVTVQLTGPQESGSGSLANSYTYKIVSGTGAFASASGSGTLTLAVSGRTFTLSIS
jgi:hypothetical protein